MNKNIISDIKLLVAFMFVATFAGCTQTEDIDNDATELNFVNFALSDNNEIQTKTKLLNDNEIEFIANDKLYIWCGEAKTGYQSAVYSQNASSASSVTVLLQTDNYGIAWKDKTTPHAFRSLYPGDNISTDAGGNPTVSLPTAIDYTFSWKSINDGNSYYFYNGIDNETPQNLLWGRTKASATDTEANTITFNDLVASGSTSVKLYYKSIMACLDLSIGHTSKSDGFSEDIFITKVVAESENNAQAIAGNFTCDLTNGQLTAAGSNSYSVTCNTKTSSQNYLSLDGFDNTAATTIRIENFRIFFPVLGDATAVNGNIKITMTYYTSADDATNATNAQTVTATIYGSVLKKGSVTPVIMANSLTELSIYTELISDASLVKTLYTETE